MRRCCKISRLPPALPGNPWQSWTEKPQPRGFFAPMPGEPSSLQRRMTAFNAEDLKRIKKKRQGRSLFSIAPDQITARERNATALKGAARRGQAGCHLPPFLPLTLANLHHQLRGESEAFPGSGLVYDTELNIHICILFHFFNPAPPAPLPSSFSPSRAATPTPRHAPGWERALPSSHGSGDYPKALRVLRFSKVLNRAGLGGGLPLPS